MIDIREAREDDAAVIAEIFHASYGDDYTFPEFYDQEFLKKLIFSDETLVLVAEDTDSGRVLGTASVVLEVGALTDLVGEFGRLAVHPDGRGMGLGNKLMEGRLERVRDRLHVGLVDGRLTHPFTQKISQSHGFAPVGFLPMMVQFGDSRESLALLVQYFGDALDLRRNHPRIVPEAYHLAVAAMENIGLHPDVIVDDEAAAYPHVEGFEIQELSADGYSDLLRIERGRVSRREIFGPLSLHYGFFKIKAQNSNYLIARQDGHIVGAIGFTHDKLERNVRVFEMIHLDDEVIRFLLEELEKRYLGWNVAVVQIGVSAHATCMQRTLVELGFLPAAYVPAHAFHRVERIDVITFLRLLEPLDLGDLVLISPTKEIVELVIKGFARREVFPELLAAVDKIDLFSGLSKEQTMRVAGICGHATFCPGERIFARGESSDEMFLLLEGEVERVLADGCSVGLTGAGECLGEVALLTGAAHAATATAQREVHAGVIRKQDLDALVRQRPDIGVVLYRNLAEGVGSKLRQFDLDHVAESERHPEDHAGASTGAADSP